MTMEGAPERRHDPRAAAADAGPGDEPDELHDDRGRSEAGHEASSAADTQHGPERHPARPTDLRPTGAPATGPTGPPAVPTAVPPAVAPGAPEGPPVATTGARAALRRRLAHASGPAQARIARVRHLSAEGLIEGRVVGPAIAQLVGLRPRSRAEAGSVALIQGVLIALITFFLRVTWERFLESGTPGRIVTGALGVATTGALVLFLISLFAHVLPVLLLGGRATRPSARNDTP